MINIGKEGQLICCKCQSNLVKKDGFYQCPNCYNTFSFDEDIEKVVVSKGLEVLN